MYINIYIAICIRTTCIKHYIHIYICTHIVIYNSFGDMSKISLYMYILYIIASAMYLIQHHLSQSGACEGCFHALSDISNIWLYIAIYMYIYI